MNEHNHTNEPKPKKNSVKNTDLEAEFKRIEKEISESKLDINQLYSWFKEEIERKDAEISRLKEENDLLFKTAVKAKNERLDMDSRRKQVEKK